MDENMRHVLHIREDLYVRLEKVAKANRHSLEEETAAAIEMYVDHAEDEIAQGNHR